MVNENDFVKRGDVIAKLPQKANFLCMARVRHLHLQIGQDYCKKEEKIIGVVNILSKTFIIHLTHTTIGQTDLIM